MSIVEKFYTMDYGVAPEDPKEAMQWLERHHRRFGEFIAGAWASPKSGEYMTTSDPSTGEDGSWDINSATRGHVGPVSRVR